MIIEGMRFTPEVLVVAPGDRVTWVNKDPFPHTVTAANKAFDSGNLPPDSSWSWVAQSAVSYAYECLLHPTMKAKLIVRPHTHMKERQ